MCVCVCVFHMYDEDVFHMCYDDVGYRGQKWTSHPLDQNYQMVVGFPEVGARNNLKSSRKAKIALNTWAISLAPKFYFIDVYNCVCVYMYVCVYSIRVQVLKEVRRGC